MSNRLPTPGGDNGDWGDILNAYLSVSLASDGTLNNNVVGTNQIQSNAVTNAQLDTPTQTAIAAVASKYVKPAGGIPSTDLTTAVQSNLTAASTAVQLGGDLGGTNSAPTVAKIQGTSVAAPSGGTSSFLNASGTWTTPAGGAGGTAGGDLSGTYPNPTVAKVNGITLPATPGTPSNQVLTYSSTNTATWTTPAAGVTLDTTATDIVADTVTGTAVAGSVGKAADAGHQHPLVAHDHSTANKGGQLNPTTALSSTGTPSSTTYLRGDNTWSTPAAGVTLDGTSSDIQALGSSAAAGSIGKAADAGHVHPTTGLVTTTTSLGGDLSGTAGSATVAKVNGVTVTGTPSSGQVITASTGTAASWSTPTTGSQALIPTAVKTSAYSANPGDFIPVDTSGGSVTITLPTTPADKSRVEIKMINTAVNTTANTGYGNNIVTFNTGGSDVLNKSGGTTSGYLTVLNQAAMLQYTASSGIWYVQGDDLPQSAVVMGIARTVNTTYSVGSTDHVIMADATSAGFTITLPTAVGFDGRYTIEAITATTNIVTLATTSSQTIEGSSTTTLGTGASGAYWATVDLVSDGANWRIV